MQGRDVDANQAMLVTEMASQRFKYNKDEQRATYTQLCTQTA
jgi:hypothetical protein